jgi:uncharacterized protein YkwD
MRDPGVYLVEVNYDTGFAASITPVVYGQTLALLPNALDLTSRTIEASVNGAASTNRESINILRKTVGVGPLIYDATLTRLAQAKADDMATNNYVGHTDSYGDTIGGLAERLQIALK